MKFYENKFAEDIAIISQHVIIVVDLTSKNHVFYIKRGGGAETFAEILITRMGKEIERDMFLTLLDIISCSECKKRVKSFCKMGDELKFNDLKGGEE